jgi:hypothetical protein
MNKGPEYLAKNNTSTIRNPSKESDYIRSTLRHLFMTLPDFVPHLIYPPRKLYESMKLLKDIHSFDFYVFHNEVKM